MGIFLVSGLALLATSVYVGVRKIIDYISCRNTRDFPMLQIDHEETKRIRCLYGIQPFEIDDGNDNNTTFSDSILIFKPDSELSDT